MYLDALEVMRPKGQSTSTGGFGVKTVAGVADDKTDIVYFYELGGLRDMFGFAHVHRVADKVAERAGLGDGMEGVASAIGEEGRHD